MLQIQTFVVNMVEENTYLIYDETREAVLIDCGALFIEERERIANCIKQQQLTLKYMLNTHGHFDHIFGEAWIADTYGIRPYIHAADVALFEQSVAYSQRFMHRHIPFEVPPIAGTMAQGDIFYFGTHSLHVIETPGHTPGGVCLYCPEGNSLFSGDSLFLSDIGRTDLPGGNYQDLIQGLKEHILPLPAETFVYPGHGPHTTIASERVNNPYLR